MAAISQHILDYPMPVSRHVLIIITKFYRATKCFECIHNIQCTFDPTFHVDNIPTSTHLLGAFISFTESPVIPPALEKLKGHVVLGLSVHLSVCTHEWTLVWYFKGSLTLAMGKCLWFSEKIKVCQLSLSSP